MDYFKYILYVIGIALGVFFVVLLYSALIKYVFGEKPSKIVAICGGSFSLALAIFGIIAVFIRGDSMFNFIDENNKINIYIQKSTTEIDSETYSKLADMTGENTDELLLYDVDVQIGEYDITTDSYGLSTGKLPVTITNTSGGIASYEIAIEATNVDGSRIGLQYVYANQLNDSQSYTTECFYDSTTNYDVSEYENAEFSVFQVQKY